MIADWIYVTYYFYVTQDGNDSDRQPDRSMLS